MIEAGSYGSEIAAATVEQRLFYLESFLSSLDPSYSFPSASRSKEKYLTCLVESIEYISATSLLSCTTTQALPKSFGDHLSY